MQDNSSIGKSEWLIMEKLWEAAPRTYTQLCHLLGKSPGWSRSTVQTMLERMTAKGLLRFEVVGRAKQYYPTVSQDQAALTETKSLLERAFDGSASMMMSTLVRKKLLSKEDIHELYAILEREDTP